MAKFLHLPMKKKWYDMVLSGEKRQEYRLVKPHWEKRIRNWIRANIPDRAGDTTIILCGDKERDTERRLPICFINGYGKDAPRFIGYCYCVEIRRIGLQKKWGEGEYDGIPHFVLHLGHIEKESVNGN